MLDTPPLMPFKLFGLQRTCTNLIKRCLLDNYHVHSLERGAEWKHGPITHPDRQWNGVPARFVVCVRDPYAWLVSCYRYFCRRIGTDRTICPHFRAGTSFADFVKSCHYEWATPVARWSEMNRHWLSVVFAIRDRCILVRAEDLLGMEAQVQQLQRIEMHFGLTRQRPTIAGCAYRVNTQGRPQGTQMDITYYQQRGYLEEYDDEMMTFVRDRLDQEVCDHLGYSRHVA